MNNGGVFLNPQMHELLVRLDRAKLETRDGEGWLAGFALRDIPQSIRSYAQQKGYITGIGKTSQRKYKILPAGRTALANNARANLALMDKIENGYVPTGEETPDALDPLFVVERPARAVIPSTMKELAAASNGYLSPSTLEKATQKNNGHSDPRAQACVQAIDILGEDWPEVTDLVDALMKLNRRKAQDHD